MLRLLWSVVCVVLLCVQGVLGTTCTYTVYNAGSANLASANVQWNGSQYSQCQMGGNEVVAVPAVNAGQSVQVQVNTSLAGVYAEIVWSGPNGSDGPCSCERVGQIQSGGGTWTIHPGGATTNYCTSVQFVNLDPFPRVVNVVENGVVVQSQVPVPVGGSLRFSDCESFPVTASIQVLNSDFSVAYSLSGSSATNSPSSGTPPAASPQFPPDVTSADAWTTNLFLPGSTNISGQFSTVYAEVASLGQQTMETLAQLQSSLSNAIVHYGGGSGGGSSSNTVYVTLTNSVTAAVSNDYHVTVTNSVGVSNFFALTNSLSITNIMQGASNVFVQNWPTGSVSSGSSALLDMLPSSATNSDAAMSAAMAIASGVDSSFGAATGAVNSALSAALGSELSSGGSGSIFSFAFCGRTIDLDPESSVMSGIFAVIKAAWTFIVIYSFLRWAGPWVSDLVRGFAGAQSGGVPDLEAEAAGFGGNVAGLIVAIAVPIAFILLWTAVFQAVIGYVLAQCGLLPSAAGALGLGGNQGALYLLNSAFPVTLVLNLGLARISLPLTGAKLMFAAAAASRFLWGR